MLLPNYQCRARHRPCDFVVCSFLRLVAGNRRQEHDVLAMARRYHFDRPCRPDQRTAARRLLYPRRWRLHPSEKTRSDSAFSAANLCAGLIIGGWYGIIYQPSDIETWGEHSRLLHTTAGLATVRGHLDFIKSLAVEFLPGSILIAPAIMIAVRGWRNTRNDLLLAAIFYSVACTLVLMFWPGQVAARYAMPGTMTLAVICGLMFENWRPSHPKVIASALVTTYLIFFALFVRGWVVMPLWPHLFDESRRAGAAISSVIQNQPLYVIGSSTDHNILVYVRGPYPRGHTGRLGKAANRLNCSAAS